MSSMRKTSGRLLPSLCARTPPQSRLLFFFGIIFAVGGLGVIGYLALTSHYLYDGIGPTAANTIIGMLSAIVDNIPLMFAVLTMNPVMSDGQWLLITLTCGVGGSLLAIGSAAGVALMGQAGSLYTFSRHLRWTWGDRARLRGEHPRPSVVEFAPVLISGGQGALDLRGSGYVLLRSCVIAKSRHDAVPLNL